MNLYKIFEEGMEDAKKNSPLILTGIACVGVVATSVLSIFAGKKLQKKDDVVKKKIEEKKAAGEIVTKKETFVLHVREKWPALAPVVVGAGVTCFCIIKSYKISAKRIAGLTVALTATEKAYDSYKKATQKLLGEKEREIEQERMRNDMLENPGNPEDEKKHLERKQVEYDNNIYNGEDAFWEPLTKQRIYCSVGDVVRAFELMNARLKSKEENFIPFTDFLYELSMHANNKVDWNRPEAQNAGWSYDKFKYGGIPYDRDYDDGIKINGVFYNKIKYKANWYMADNEINFIDY